MWHRVSLSFLLFFVIRSCRSIECLSVLALMHLRWHLYADHFTSMISNRMKNHVLLMKRIHFFWIADGLSSICSILNSIKSICFDSTDWEKKNEKQISFCLPRTNITRIEFFKGKKKRQRTFFFSYHWFVNMWDVKRHWARRRLHFCAVDLSC